MPKIISQETARKIVELRDKERLSFKEIGEKLGLSPETVAKYYKIEKNKEISKSIEELKGYEKATANEVQEYARERGLTIEDVAQRIYELEQAGIDIRDLKEGIEIYKAIKEIGGEKDIKDIKEVLLYLKKNKKNLDFLKDLERRIEELNREIKHLKKIRNEIKSTLVLNPEYIIERIKEIKESFEILIIFLLFDRSKREALFKIYGIEEFDEVISNVLRKINRLIEELEEYGMVSKASSTSSE